MRLKRREGKRKKKGKRIEGSDQDLNAAETVTQCVACYKWDAGKKMRKWMLMGWLCGAVQ